MNIPTVIESPYAGDSKRNMAYLYDCMLDSIARGEAPFASHLIYTQVLNDAMPDERKLGIEMGYAWATLARRMAVYIDLGISFGMAQAIQYANQTCIQVEFRCLKGKWES